MPRRFVDDGDHVPVRRRSTSSSGGPPPVSNASGSSRSSPIAVTHVRSVSSGGASNNASSVAFMLSQTPPRGNGNSRQQPSPTIRRGHSSCGSLRLSRTPSPATSGSGHSTLLHKQPSSRDQSSPRNALYEGTTTTTAALPTTTLSRSSSVPSRTDDDEDVKPEMLAKMQAATPMLLDYTTWDESSSLSGTDVGMLNSSSTLGGHHFSKSLGASGGGLAMYQSSATGLAIQSSSSPQPTTTMMKEEADADEEEGSVSIDSQEATTKEKPFLIPEDKPTTKTATPSESSVNETSATTEATKSSLPVTELQTRAVSYVLGDDDDDDDDDDDETQYNLEDATKDVWGDPKEDDDEDRKMSAKEAKAEASRQMQRRFDAELSAEKRTQVSAMHAGIAAGVAMAKSDGKKPSTPAISNLAATQAKAAERAMMTPDERMAADTKDKERRIKERIREERALAAACTASNETIAAAAKPPPLQEQQIFSAPGAHRVAGINASNSVSDFDYTVDGDDKSSLQPSAANESAMPSVFSAHVVDDVEALIVSNEDEAKDYEPYVGEPLPPPPEPDPIFYARPYDETTLDPDSVKGLVRNPRVQGLLVVTGLVFLGLIAGIVFGIMGIMDKGRNNDALLQPPDTPAPTPNMLIAVLEAALSPQSFELVINDPTSPQAKAWEWWRKDTLSQDGNLQRFAMATLYYAAGGQDWSRRDGWLGPETECSWFSTSSRSTCVDSKIERLELVNMTLDGSIPPEISLLESIRVLNLSLNGLKGTIPSSLFKLARLEKIRIDCNILTGTLASEVGMLGSLVVLDISYNELTGTLPTELGLLSSMSTLVLGTMAEDKEPDSHGSSDPMGQQDPPQRNRFVGGIPSEIGSLQSLRSLVLSASDGLMGSLPTELGQLTLLENLQAQSSTLEGPLPSELGLLTMLRRLELGSNSLTGSIPRSWAPLATTLRTLTLKENELTGIIPAFGWTSTADDVLHIQVQCNEFTGNIPSSVCTEFNPFLPVISADCNLTERCLCCFPCESLDPCRLRW